MQQGELTRDMLAAMLRQLGIDRREFQTMIYAYPCKLTPSEEGGYLVIFPDVPEAITGGATRSNALEVAEDALATALAGYVHEEWDIPEPSPLAEDQDMVSVPAVVAAKLMLYSAMRAQRITPTELASKLEISGLAARKLADPDLVSTISQVEKALRVVGRSLVVSDVV